MCSQHRIKTLLCPIESRAPNVASPWPGHSVMLIPSASVHSNYCYTSEIGMYSTFDHEYHIHASYISHVSYMTLAR